MPGKRTIFLVFNALIMEKLQIEMEKIEVHDWRIFRSLFDTFFPRSCAFAAKLLNDEQAGEDVAQETFLNIWERTTNFPNLLAFKAYLYTTLKNKCINLLKISPDAVDVAEVKDILVYETEIDHLIIEEEVRVRILQEINKLSGVKREVMLLRLEGKSYEDISQELHLSINTVKTHKKDSYKQLRLGLTDCDKSILLFWLFKKYNSNKKNEK